MAKRATGIQTSILSMVNLSFSEIKQKVDELAAKINAPVNSLPTYGYSTPVAKALGDGPQAG